MTGNAPIRVFITGACAGLAEVRQALGSHPEIEIVGTAVEPARAAQKLASSNAQVVLHGSSRGDRLPAEDVEAIRQATAAPIVLVTSGSANGLLQEALAHGVARRRAAAAADGRPRVHHPAHARAERSGRAQQAGPAHCAWAPTARSSPSSRPRAASARRRLACGLATCFARRQGRRVAARRPRSAVRRLRDHDGHRAREDDLRPRHDVGRPRSRTSSPATSPSTPPGVHVVPAPVRPEDAELVAEDRVAHLLEVAKEAYDVIVVDTPTHFHATTLATLDRTDRLALMASLDIPTVKNVKLTLQTLEPPALPGGAHRRSSSTAPHAARPSSSGRRSSAPWT